MSSEKDRLLNIEVNLKELAQNIRDARACLQYDHKTNSHNFMGFNEKLDEAISIWNRLKTDVNVFATEAQKADFTEKFKALQKSVYDWEHRRNVTPQGHADPKLRSMINVGALSDVIDIFLNSIVRKLAKY